MDIRQLMQWIVNKYGYGIDVVFYPDMSGHVCITASYNIKEKDLLEWNNLEELISKLISE